MHAEVSQDVGAPAHVGERVSESAAVRPVRYNTSGRCGGG